MRGGRAGSIGQRTCSVQRCLPGAGERARRGPHSGWHRPASCSLQVIAAAARAAARAATAAALAWTWTLTAGEVEARGRSAWMARPRGRRLPQATR